MTRLLALLVFLPGLALADSFRDLLEDASDSLEDASAAAQRIGGPCKGIVSGLTRGMDDIDSVRRGTTDRRMAEIQTSLSNLPPLAATLGCTPKVTNRINQAVVALTSARVTMASKDNHHRHRHDDGDGDDDDRGGGHHDNRRDDDHNQPPLPPPPPSSGRLEATLGDLRVIYGERVENDVGVRVELTSAMLRNAGRTPFYFGGRIRAQGGEWSEWVTGPQYSAPSDPYSWTNVYSQFFPARVLRSADRGGGHFVARISLFDGNRNELAFKEVPVELVGQPPAQPNPTTFPPAPPPAQPSNVARDCGTGRDPGCNMQRNGGYAMDRDTWAGFYDSLRRTNSDLSREDMVKSVLASNWVTAAQLGMILELFNSDLLRLDAAKAAAPHTVNPQHALGLTSKFTSSLLQSDFTRLMSSQR